MRLSKSITAIIYFIILYIEQLSLKDGLEHGYLVSADAKSGARQALGAEPLETCGKRPGLEIMGAKRKKTSLRISNGAVAKEGQFPSYANLKASIKNGNDIVSMGCGGTLVGPKTVISAAHCLHNVKTMHDLTIELGQNGPKKIRRQYKVAKICHESDHCVTKSTWDKSILPVRDFAIFELSERVEYNDYIQPACLSYELEPSYKSTAVDEFDATGMGWFNNWQDLPNELMLTPMKRECDNQTVNNYHNLHPLVDCYRSENESNLCQGDSGGPLYYYRKVMGEVRHFLAAITSFGIRDCRSKSYPVGFTNIEAYADKIANIMNQTNCYNMILKNSTKSLECVK